MKNLLYSLSVLSCFILSQCCNQVGSANKNPSKPDIKGEQTSNQKKPGDNTAPVIMQEPPNDTSIHVGPRVEIKHNSDDQQKLDSLKRVNMKKKKGE
jgi:hypothetical protein